MRTQQSAVRHLRVVGGEESEIRLLAPPKPVRATPWQIVLGVLGLVSALGFSMLCWIGVFTLLIRVAHILNT